MGRRFVTVNDLNELPKEIVAKLNELFLSRTDVSIILPPMMESHLASKSSSSPVNNMVVKYNGSGFFTVKDANNPQEPVSLAQLDQRVPPTGIPVATEIASGLMSANDKMALRKAGWQNKMFATATEYNKFFEPGNWIVDIAEYNQTIPVVMSQTTANYNGTTNTVATRETAGTIEKALWEGARPAEISWIVLDKLNSNSTLKAENLSGTINPLRLPDATASAKGALSSAFYTLLNGATDVATADRLVKRNSTGLFSVANPTADTHPVPRSFATNASNLSSGTVNQARLPAATTTTQGAMSAADKAKLDAATVFATANTIPQRNSAGNIDVGTATNANQATNRAYVDALFDKSVTLYGDLGNKDLNTLLVEGDYYVTSSSSASLLNNYPMDLSVGTVSVRKFSLSGGWVIQRVVRWADGVVSYRATNDAGVTWKPWSVQATVDYVDRKKWSGADITTGVIHPDRIANATSILDGLMSKADKALLDGATVSATANTIMRRNSLGEIMAQAFFVPAGTVQSTNGAAMTRKDYVDAQVATRAPSSHSHGVDDLTPGNMTMTHIRLTSTGDASETSTAHPFQTGLDSSLNIIIDNNEIIGRNNGVLAQVGFPSGIYSLPEPVSPTSATRKSYVDAKTWDGSAIATGTISPNRIANATSALDGLMSKADKAKLDKATPAATPNTLVLSDSAGRFQVPAPSTNGLDVANRAYVDGKKWSGADITTGTVHPDRIANATSVLDGLMSKADKAKLDGAAYHPTGASLVMSSSAGYIKGMAMFVDENTPQQTQAHALTRKDYVDAQTSNASNLTTGTVNPARIANATSNLDGLMSKADKAKLDGATREVVSNALVFRDAAGRFKVPDPSTGATDVANKGYVDGYEVLWTGSQFMNASQTVDIPGGIASRKTGIVLVWGGYDNGAPANHSFTYDFVPKAHIELFTGYGVICTSTHGNNAGTPQIIVKYVYVNNTRITGNDANSDGISKLRVLRAVIGI